MSDPTFGPTRVPVYRTITKGKISTESQDQSNGDLIVQVSKDQENLIPIRTTNGRFLWKVAKCLCLCFRRGPVKVYVAPMLPIDPIIPQQSPENKGKKTLVLDLDETLVHSTFKKIDSPDTVLQVFVDNRDITIYVRYRPGMQELLEAAAKKYELVVFTASLAKYADPLLDIIDPGGLVEVRLFRDSCKRVNETYVKDLRSLGRDMSQNSPDSYSLQPENAIPIRSFFDDPDDIELFKLIPMLEDLAAAVDVRETLRSGMDLTASCLLPMPRETREESGNLSVENRPREDYSIPGITDGTQADLRSELNSPRKP